MGEGSGLVVSAWVGRGTGAEGVGLVAWRVCGGGEAAMPTQFFYGVIHLLL